MFCCRELGCLLAVNFPLADTRLDITQVTLNTILRRQRRPAIEEAKRICCRCYEASIPARKQWCNERVEQGFRRHMDTHSSSETPISGPGDKYDTGTVSWAGCRLQSGAIHSAGDTVAPRRPPTQFTSSVKCESNSHSLSLCRRPCKEAAVLYAGTMAFLGYCRNHYNPRMAEWNCFEPIRGSTAVIAVFNSVMWWSLGRLVVMGGTWWEIRFVRALEIR